MQTELASEHPDLAIALLSVNERGRESGLPQLVAEGDLPVLQEDNAQRVWESWNASWRDVVVLDPRNEALGVFNLTTFTLDSPDNYEELKAILVAAAQGEDVSGRLAPLPE